MYVQKIHEQIKVVHRRPQRPIYIHKTTESKQTYKKGTFYLSIKLHNNKVNVYLVTYFNKALNCVSVTETHHRLYVHVSTVGWRKTRVR